MISSAAAKTAKPEYQSELAVLKQVNYAMQILRKNTSAYYLATQKRRATKDYTCRYCGQTVYFDSKHISPTSGKKIPLDPGTRVPHDCPSYIDIPGRRLTYFYPTYSYYLRCRYCGKEIYFSKRYRSKNHKPIPIDRASNMFHNCLNKSNKYYYSFKKRS